ncbi:MAG: VOC family protein [Cyanobacteria bacterium]|nr:VOC family protein [Cyanobacteriota bacterium]
MNLDYIVMYVHQLEPTLSFYQTAFGLTVKFRHDSGQYAEMMAGAITLGFAEHSLMASLLPIDYLKISPSSPPPGIQLSFKSDQIGDDYHRALQNGAISVSAPKNMPWGDCVAYIRDINGFLIEICQKKKTLKEPSLNEQEN